jgi:hypothetical protein
MCGVCLLDHAGTRRATTKTMHDNADAHAVRPLFHKPLPIGQALLFELGHTLDATFNSSQLGFVFRVEAQLTQSPQKRDSVTDDPALSGRTESNAWTWSAPNVESSNRGGPIDGFLACADRLEL